MTSVNVTDNNVINNEAAELYSIVDEYRVSIFSGSLLFVLITHSLTEPNNVLTR